MPDMFDSATRLRLFAGAVALAASTLSSAALAQQGYPPPSGYNSPGYQQAPPAGAQGGQVNPICPRLEAQLASIDRGGMDQGRADQIRRFEDAANRQQAELDRVSMQAKRMGCESSGFFSLFSGQSAQCGPINNQIQQMRGNLDQMNSSLERLRSGGPGGNDRENQRRSVIQSLAQNNCGPQYAAAAQQQGGGLFNNLFNGGNSSPAPGFGMPGGDYGNAEGGTFRTVCVRSCDGYYFPISFATVPSRFADDERTCKSLCPASEASLYAYRNPGQDMNQAVSINGQPYTSLPNAFRYRQSFNPSCSCKPANQTWADAMKGVDDRSAAEHGDIIVTEESAKKLSAPPTQRTSAKSGGKAAPATASNQPDPGAPATDPSKIRTVGPKFYQTPPTAQ
ncbi:DUF2865 domain-containing protein [Rhodopseudomonas sp. BR0M22]|uniref:DUF2865 domain-containing protein n=1 Tax=Rhodopseudomonas sp. BR0M22 TaxID=2269369 RepID=UPI0013DEA3D6|nr:DUF2865 domain-containing protein [Rhodopseudomonas sp. BR0M22]NEW90656.1 DUF2865 domain-containing protein [Rhodopseudomonas sp. BR0M22]